MGRVTISDVARKCGVSKYTVSVALRDRPGVAHETRRRILAAAKELNFRPCFTARSLSRGRTELIALQVPYVNDSFFGILVDLFGVVLPRQGYNMLLELVWDESHRRAKGVELVLEGRVDGLLIWGGVYGEEEWKRIDEAARSWPIVAFGTDVGPTVDCVDINRQEGFARATRYLAGLGHRTIGLVDFSPIPQTGDAYSARGRGYLLGLEQAGLTYDRRRHFVISDVTEAGGYALAKEIAGFADRPTALVVCSTRPALGLIHGLIESGLRVPNDVAIVAYGLDEQADALYAEVPLTVIGVPRERLVQHSVELLMARLKDKEDSEDRRREKIVIDPQLVIRKSCGGRG